MMRRPDQIRLVYRELRRDFPDLAAWEILKLAHVIVEAHHKPDIGQIEEYPGRPGFHATELDKAIADGGWKVLEFERRGGMRFDD